MNDWLKPSIIYAVIIPSIVILFYSLISKLFPITERPPIEKYNLEIIRKKFRFLEILLYVGTFLLTPLFTYIFAKPIFLAQTQHLSKLLIGLTYKSGASFAAFILPSFFLALFFSGSLVGMILEVVGKKVASSVEEWKVFYFDMNRRQARGIEFDNRKISLVIGIIILLVYISMSYLAFDNYFLAGNESLTFNRYLSLKEEKYNYGDIKRITLINKYKDKQTGEITPKEPYYEIIMNDGTRWTTLNLEINRSEEEKRMMDYISRKSAVPIVEN